MSSLNSPLCVVMAHDMIYRLTFTGNKTSLTKTSQLGPDPFLNTFTRQKYRKRRTERCTQIKTPQQEKQRSNPDFYTKKIKIIHINMFLTP